MIQLFELVPQGFDRNNRLVERGEFLLESSDMDVDRPRRSIVIVSPDGIEKDVSCEDSAGIAQEMFEQAELFRCEWDLNLFHGDFVSREIHHEIAVAKLSRAVVRLLFKPSKEGLDAGHQGLGAEWFGDVVVGSQFQTDDGVRLLGFGGQHDDGEHRGCRSRSKAFADLEAVDLRQHQVEDDQVGLFLLRVPEAFHTSLGQDGLKTFFLQIEFDQLENVVLIFNDEDFFSCGGWHSWWEPTREMALCQDMQERRSLGQLC